MLLHLDWVQSGSFQSLSSSTDCQESHAGFLRRKKRNQTTQGSEHKHPWQRQKGRNTRNLILSFQLFLLSHQKKCQLCDFSLQLPSESHPTYCVFKLSWAQASLLLPLESVDNVYRIILLIFIENRVDGLQNTLTYFAMRPWTGLKHNHSLHWIYSNNNQGKGIFILQGTTLWHLKSQGVF